MELPKQSKRKEEEILVAIEVEEMVLKGAIQKIYPCQGQFLKQNQFIPYS